MVDSKQVESFYDDWVFRSINDYVYGNLRIEAAVSRVLKHLPEGPIRLLEVGCGMGVATNTIAEARPDCEIVAIDISPRRIEYAKKLFPQENVKYIASDAESFLRGGVPTEEAKNNRFDVVCMIDVVEHLPPGERIPIFRDIGQLMIPAAKLILTYPTTLFQDHIRSNSAHELQIIDENIDLEKITEIAEALSGVVVFHRYIDIWKHYDYAHTVIERNPLFADKTPIPSSRGLIGKILRRAKTAISTRDERSRILERREYAEKRLGIKLEDKK